jgi:hypothetical protein
MNRTNSLVIACALLSLVLLACNGAEETARQSEASPPPEATTVVAPAATRETLDTTKTTPTPGKPLPDDTTDPSTPSALSSDVSSSAPAEPTPTSPPSSEGADGAYLTCCVRVWDGFVAMLDAIATAGEAADTDVFCEAQMEWDSTVRELRASHAECPKPADSGLVHASRNWNKPPPCTASSVAPRT